MTADALPMTGQIDLIDNKKFVKVAIDKNSEIFLVYVATIEFIEATIHLLCIT